MLSASTPNIRFNEPDIHYGRDREKVLHKDISIPEKQNVVAVSFLENDPRALRVHGCFPDTESAKCYIEQLVAEMHAQSLPFPKHTAIFDTGVWRSWPPTRENTEKFSVQDKNIDEVLQAHYESRAKAKKELLEKAFHSANATSKDEQVLLEAIDNLGL